jgi:hypothetical protein
MTVANAFRSRLPAALLGVILITAGCAQNGDTGAWERAHNGSDALGAPVNPASSADTGASYIPSGGQNAPAPAK